MFKRRTKGNIIVKLINRSTDFKKYDVIFNSKTDELFKCTTGNYIKAFHRSTGNGTYLSESHICERVWWNMGPLSALIAGLKRKAKRDIAALEEKNNV